MDAPKTFEFAGILFEPVSGVLRSASGSRRLEPRAADVLAKLCADPGQLVTRGRLLDECWGAEAGSDEGLTQAIAQIRRALESLGAPRDLVATYPKRGYRLSSTPQVPRQASGIRIPLWAPLGAIAAACILILVIAPGWPRHLIRHAFGLGPAHHGAAETARPGALH